MTETTWPKQNQAWRRLVEEAREALESMRSEHGFRSARSELNGDGPVASISSYMATAAILDLRDRAPQWARPVEELGEALHKELLTDDPIAVLKGLHEEVSQRSRDRTRSKSIAEKLAKEFGSDPLTLVLPVATATVLATRARAQLLFQDKALEPSAELLATLILQSRILLAGDALATMRVHPYAVYKVAHGLWLSTLVLDASRRDHFAAINEELARVKHAVHGLTERLLARSRIGAVRDGEHVALVFCAGALALAPLDPRYVIEALSAAARGQSARGDWPQGRIVGSHNDPDTGASLEVSSHEVGLAFVEAIFCLGLLPGVVDRITPEVTLALQRAVDYLRESRVPLVKGADKGLQDSSAVGWCSAHIYGQTQIEAKATAAALRLTIGAHGVAEQERSVQALEHFEDVWNPEDHTPPYLEWATYIKENEPDGGNPILPYLDQNFVQRARDEKAKDRRPWARTQSMSAILFGPPGTTKTTIVKSMAQGLGWPLVTLSPGTFIRDGLENVEKRAIEVFSSLQDLVRVVVLFDECDELFRARRHARRDGGTDSDNSGNEGVRSISAFMTASMLPKLQDLRDNGQVFFVIATNYFDQIDSAAKRIGRIDRILGVSWPDERQRANMLKQKLAEDLSPEMLGSEPVIQTIAELSKRTRYFVRGELVELANELSSAPEKLEAADNETAVNALADEIMANKSRTVEDADIDAFRREAEARSACHRPNHGELVK